MTDLVIRPLVAGEEHLFDSLSDPGLVGRAALGETYAGGGYRPEWTWVALRGGVVVARAAWWAGPDDPAPLALDWFDFTDRDAGVTLLRAAPLRAEYSLLLPHRWRDDPLVAAQAQARIEAATAAGMRVLVERFRYRWTPECGLPARPGRLEFRPEPDDAVILDVLRRVGEGSLDAHFRHAAALHGPEAAAREDLDLLRWLPSPRDWWQLAWTPDRELAGIVVPARNPAGHVVGFVGVLPEQRGHGYAYDLLVEATHRLVEVGAESVVAATDQGNTPMAATFARAGYRIEWERVDLV
ncbi:MULTISPECIES: GNAT family N-acetyltransferase [Micromonospora]|uniref:GNAT family N-acetyltransferase n=1 Tax=Micromonospora solifontis TaxID=2487138 RepID=A0ABX9WK77_9ACTN|nr:MULTISPECIES: GNAT family N-acetyltransferase [Micromonospora]NES13670.1 GNAT family N-acetyltransferase [Micromonospora sp. PPF5-17B]NES35479.1 GNAT family N-acetyltransferase [Micromonospora solifontis]NES55364.1 GNAT family N-acetyltransferase [Micromonospora sp. PPF5-6]RNM00729.1 GNAT family N-acetyltransferase [Micromonospora solifontis]